MCGPEGMTSVGRWGSDGLIMAAVCGPGKSVGGVGMEVRWEPETENVMNHHEGLNVTDNGWEATGEERGWARRDMRFGQMTEL